MVVTGPVTYDRDPEIGVLLVRPDMNAEVMAAAERIEARLGPVEFAERLGAVAEDTSAHWLVRINALYLLADRGFVSELPTFGAVLKSPDERIRLAAVTGMRNYLSIRPDAAIDVLAVALKDSSPRVVTAALQVLADRDVALLRELYARTRHPEIRTITRDLIRVAEERGAPLSAAASGTLERTTASGAQLTFQPTQRYPQWDAAVGNLIVTPPGGKAVTVATGVEVVGNVVPAFFTVDGRHLVYEVNREIHVHDLQTGADTTIAQGIAPRLLPFTNDVIYFVEQPKRRSITPNSVGYTYDVVRMPVTGGEATIVDDIGLTSLNDLKGNYSPLRWSRIEEQEGAFFLVGETFDDLRLPSPFGE